MLELHQVTKIYQLGKIDVVAVRNIDMRVMAGEFIALAGPSGSGKTTILNILGCLDSPTSGEVNLEGRDITTLPQQEKTKIRRRKIGFIFQSFNLIPVLSVYENVEYPLLLDKSAPVDRHKRVCAVLDEVGLAHRAKHFPNELSGGERQRVSIARALVKKPSIILADEPTANLDSTSGRNIIDLMDKLNREEKVTFIFSSHDPQILSKAQKLIELRDGVIMRVESRADITLQESGEIS